MPKLCLIEGDGIGKEVVPAALSVLQAAVPNLEVFPAQAGWECFLERGCSVPPETLQTVRACGTALFGAVASPSHKVEGYHSAILTLRKELNLYANIRPVYSLPNVSPRPDVNLVIVRENTEGLYSGRERIQGDTAIAERVITRAASVRIGRKALEIAKIQGFGRVTIIHKANVLPLTDGLFCQGIYKASRQLEQETGWRCTIDELLVDTAAMYLASQPERFQVLVTTNLFGDILSDIAAVWCGGLGLAPSLNWGESAALAEPVHGSAPDIAGRGTANPIAAILSAALLVRWAWGLPDSAGRIEQAVWTALKEDFPPLDSAASPALSTAAITQAILLRLGTTIST
jgi:homoisocitrate dehydrogenase